MVGGQHRVDEVNPNRACRLDRDNNSRIAVQQLTGEKGGTAPMQVCVRKKEKQN
jgi:hypothetical protein